MSSGFELKLKVYAFHKLEYLSGQTVSPKKTPLAFNWNRLLGLTLLRVPRVRFDECITDPGLSNVMPPPPQKCKVQSAFSGECGTRQTWIGKVQSAKCVFRRVLHASGRAEKCVTLS